MKFSAAVLGLSLLSLLLAPAIVQATSYTVTLTLRAPGGRILWTLTTTVETRDSTLVLRVPQRLYDLIVSTFSTDTFTTPFSVSLRGGLVLSVESLPPGLTIVFKAVPLGEVVLDGQVNILDVATLAFSFGRGPGVAGYNAYADFNIDGRVDILDAAALALNYGLSY